MKKIILTLVLIAGIFIVTQAQRRGTNHPRKFKQERRFPKRPKQKIRPFERRQRAELRRVHRRHKMRRQSRTVMLQEQFNLYAENSKQAA